MSIRITLCFLFVLGFSYYAWRNWFVSLCGAIALMAVIMHPDMPRNMSGIQGLNPWNFLILNVTLACLRQRQQEGLRWDMPQGITLLFLLYFLIIITAALRLLADDGRYNDLFNTGYVISEHIVNCLKWVIPGILLFYGCQTRRRVYVAMTVILAVYLLLALQVIRWVPLSAATDGGGINKAARVIQNEIGYNRVTLSMMLGGASWAILCCMVLFQDRRHQLGVLAAAVLVMFGQALTGGRMGYLSWIAVGLILSLFRWRKLLLFIPVVLTLVVILLPGVRERMLMGLGQKQGSIIVQGDEDEMTSGRTIAWPLVIEAIQKNPITGYGRQAMTITGIQNELAEDFDEPFPHPHNAYLEQLLDNGVIGFLLVISFYLAILGRAFPLLLDRSDPLCTAIGATVCALVLALLVGAMGGQTFYPREGSVCMWAAIGLMLRVSVERTRARATGQPLFGESEDGATIDLPEDSTQPA